MLMNKSLGLDLQQAIDLSIKERVHMRETKTGKNVLLPLWTEGARLLFLGRSTMLYLIFVRWAFFFFLLLSIIQIPQAYFYFASQSNDQNIWYRFSIANWRLTENYAVNIAIGCLEIFSLLLVIVYIRVFLWWIKKNSKLTEDIIVTTGDFSVEVTNVPANTVELKWLGHFRNFFSRFGFVNNVALALDSDNIGSLKKKMEHYAKLVRITQQRVERAKHFVWFERLKLAWYNYMYTKKSSQFKKHVSREHYKCLGYAYVTFDTELARWQCLNTFNKPVLTSMCSKGPPKYFGKKFGVSKSEEPSNIIWENAGYTNCGRGLRRLFGIFVTFLLVIVSVGLSALLISQRDSFAFSKALLPQNGTNASNLAVISTNFIGTALLSVCLFVILQALNWCLYYINFFEKHRYKSTHRKSLMIKTAIGSFLCTLVSFIPFLRADADAPPNFTIPWKINGINNGTGIPTVFTEDSGFYYTLFMCLLTSAIGGIVKETLLGPIHWLRRQYNIAQALTQEDLNWAYEPPRYSLQYRYSTLLSIISIALAFSGMTPVTLWIMTGTLFVIFFVDKYNLLRIYKKESYARDLMALNAVRTLAIGYFFRFFVMWFLLAYKAIAKSEYASNGFLYMITVALAVAFAYLIFQSIFAYGNIFNCMCCNHFRRAKFLTEKGQVSITRFKEMEKFDPPIKPEDVVLNRSRINLTNKLN